MDEALVKRVQESPAYRTLVRKRTRLAWALTTTMLVAYFAYIGLIAFDKRLMARPIGEGTMSLGIPLGFGLIVFTVILTGVYVWRANSEFDGLVKQIQDEAQA